MPFKSSRLTHADFDDEWFRGSVAHRWRDGDALIPAEWLEEQAAEQLLEDGIGDAMERSGEAWKEARASDEEGGTPTP